MVGLGSPTVGGEASQLRQHGVVSLHWSGWEARPPTGELPSFANKRMGVVY
ncbi:MAG: hypothetical protein IJR26_04055 [Bacteroidales bacterium]|nr:hypothetical protein [Bacteroidales bacterium]